MPMEIDIIPAAGNLVVRRLQNSAQGGIVTPNSDKGTECVIAATSDPTVERLRPGTTVFVARTVGVPVGGDEDDDLWFVGIDDVLGWKKEGAS